MTNRAALPPEDPAVCALYGDHVHRALHAVDQYFGHRPEPAAFEERMRTVRAYAGGTGFFALHLAPLARHLPSDPDDAFEGALLMARRWPTMNGPDVPFRDALSRGAEDALRHAHDRWTLVAAAAAVRALSNETACQEFLRVGGFRGHGTALPVVHYWRQVYRGLLELVRLPATQRGPDWWLLRPQERAHLAALKGGPAATPRRVAAGFAWDRAGRPGSLTTFADRLGTRVSGEEARALDPGEALEAVYHAKPEPRPAPTIEDDVALARRVERDVAAARRAPRRRGK